MNLMELIYLYQIRSEDIKIHMAIGAKQKNEPWIELAANRFKKWQEVQTKENFQRKYILSLVYLRKNEWLFAGIYTSDSCKKNGSMVKYKTTLTTYGKEYIGRMVVGFVKEFRSSYLRAEKHLTTMEIKEIHRDKFICDPFPGYNNVNINFELLKLIVSAEEYSWKTALSVVKGIYVITDTKTGKLYIGKADGKGAIWQRWSSYAVDGHGNNDGLVELLQKEGTAYAENFQYSILEVLSKNTDDDFIDQRETFWKNVFLTKKYGYNKN